jgi:uncharacterized protein YeaC (DUF1315 family)
LSQNFPDIELIDISGDIYLNMVLDGTYVTGHGADELMGSLDKSFFDQGAQTNVLRPWKDFFVEQQLDTDFIDWSTEFFSGAHRPVQNLLHARWWFYTCCKLQYLNTVNSLLFGTNQSVDLDNFLAFYDCDIFESWAWHNLDSVIEDSTDYSTWKKCLRRYVYQKWPDDDYLHHTQKVNSIQLVIYRLKKQWLNDTHWIGILETGQVLRTPNLPLFSMKEWQLTYNGRYDYLWQ